MLIALARSTSCLLLVTALGCGNNSAAKPASGAGAGGAEAASPDVTDPQCLGTPKAVPAESSLINIGMNSYIVGPEGGTFDLTDTPSVSIVISPCAVDEPVRFSYGKNNTSLGVGGAQGASVFIAFLTIPASKPGNLGYTYLHGDVTLIWHDAPSPQKAKIWGLGDLGFEQLVTTVQGGDVSATNKLSSQPAFALGE